MVPDICLSQIQIAIEAPVTANVGDLVKLKAQILNPPIPTPTPPVPNPAPNPPNPPLSTDHELNHVTFAWAVIPDAPDNFLPIENGTQAVFATPIAGIYTFVLAGSDGKQLSIITKSIEILNPNPPPGPGPGPNPVPGPNLSQLVKNLAGKVNSKTKAEEAQKLALSFETVANLITAGTLTNPAEIIKSTTTSNRAVLGTAAAVWADFFAGLAAYLNEAAKTTLKTPEQHATVWKEIANTLRTVK